MFDPEPSPWFFWFSFGWVAFWIALSVIVRKGRGKPIFPSVPADAIYSEKSASGPWASRVLIVAVTPNRLVIVPRFPFNLMFLPEVFGSERDVSRAAISGVNVRKGLASNVVIALRNSDTIKLEVKDPTRFSAALGYPV